MNNSIDFSIVCDQTNNPKKLDLQKIIFWEHSLIHVTAQKGLWSIKLRLCGFFTRTSSHHFANSWKLLFLVDPLFPFLHLFFFFSPGSTLQCYTDR